MSDEETTWDEQKEDTPDPQAAVRPGLRRRLGNPQQACGLILAVRAPILPDPDRTASARRLATDACRRRFRTLPPDSELLPARL